jgi:hypothetical protein
MRSIIIGAGLLTLGLAGSIIFAVVACTLTQGCTF